MQKCTTLLALLLVAVGAMAGNSETSMVPIMRDAEKIVSVLEDQHDMEIVRMEYDILRTTKTTTRTLSKGWTYMIVAFGDFRFKDIDVKLYRRSASGWLLVDKDDDESDTAIVSVTPEYDEDYMIEISAYKFNPGYEVGHYGLVIAHE